MVAASRALINFSFRSFISPERKVHMNKLTRSQIILLITLVSNRLDFLQSGKAKVSEAKVQEATDLLDLLQGLLADATK